MTCSSRQWLRTNQDISRSDMLVNLEGHLTHSSQRHKIWSIRRKLPERLILHVLVHFGQNNRICSKTQNLLVASSAADAWARHIIDHHTELNCCVRSQKRYLQFSGFFSGRPGRTRFRELRRSRALLTAPALGASLQRCRQRMAPAPANRPPARCLPMLSQVSNALLALFCGSVARAFDSFPFCTGASASAAIVSCASSADVGGAAEAVASSATECGEASTPAFSIFLEQTCQMNEACTVLHLASQEST